MQLLIARHGNTFGPNDKVVFAGATNDLPLVEKGFQQASNIANYLAEQNILPDIIFVSPLIRTIDYGKRIKEDLNLSCEIKITEALKEVDYGLWTGLSNEEIINLGFKKELDNWNNFGIFPVNCEWTTKEEELKNSIISFTNALIENYSQLENILLVSSNGIIRYFLTLIEGLFEKHKEEGRLKIKTGSLSSFKFSESSWELNFWNKTP